MKGIRTLQYQFDVRSNYTLRCNGATVQRATIKSSCSDVRFHQINPHMRNNTRNNDSRPPRVRRKQRHIQRRLLSETELDLKKALELALGMETAAKNVRELQGTRRAAEPQLPKDVCKVQREVMNNCYRCGKQNRKYAQCPFRTAKCHNCGKVGHIRNVCRQPNRPLTSQGRQTQRHPVKTVQEGIEDPNELQYVLHTLSA